MIGSFIHSDIAYQSPVCQATYQIQHVKQAFALSLCWESVVVQCGRRQLWQAWLVPGSKYTFRMCEYITKQL